MSERSELGLYLPGVTPLGEEQARELQTGARTTLQSIDHDPSGTVDLALGENVSWQCLPDPDLQLWRDEAKSLCSEIVTADSAAAIDRVMQTRFESLVSWTMTAEAWERGVAGNLVFQCLICDAHLPPAAGVAPWLCSQGDLLRRSRCYEIKVSLKRVVPGWRRRVVCEYLLYEDLSSRCSFPLNGNAGG
jgi:hypothetical protein